MKLYQFVLLVLLYCVPVNAQDFMAHEKVSLALGYGTSGPNIYADIRLKRFNTVEPLTSLSLKLICNYGSIPAVIDQGYVDINGQPSSGAVTVSAYGLCLGAEARYGHFSLYPYLGLRYYAADFAQQYVRDYISQNGIQRYTTDNSGNPTPIGDRLFVTASSALAVDIGGTAGYYLSRTVELGALLGLSPAEFDQTMAFGKTMPDGTLNPFHVPISPFRFEVRVRFSLGE